VRTGGLFARYEQMKSSNLKTRNLVELGHERYLKEVLVLGRVVTFLSLSFETVPHSGLLSLHLEPV
jgi:hypothetical protein